MCGSVGRLCFSHYSMPTQDNLVHLGCVVHPDGWWHDHGTKILVPITAIDFTVDFAQRGSSIMPLIPPTSKSAAYILAEGTRLQTIACWGGGGAANMTRICSERDLQNKVAVAVAVIVIAVCCGRRQRRSRLTSSLPWLRSSSSSTAIYVTVYLC